MTTDLLGTRQEKWFRRAITGSTSALSQFGAYAHQTSAPTDDPSNGLNVISLPNHDSSGATSCSFAIMAFAKAVNAANRPKVRLRIWGLSGTTSTDLLGKYLADLEVTIGSTTGSGATGTLFLNRSFGARIKDLDDRTLTPPAIRFVANEPANEASPSGIAIATFIDIGFKTMVVEVRKVGGEPTDEVGICWRVF